MELDTHELAWAAGFVDGEGCFGSYRRTRRGNYGMQMGINQCDPEVLHRFRNAVGGLGNITGPFDKTAGGLRPNTRPQWIYQVGAAADVREVVRLLWPYLGTIKREQARRMLDTFEAHRPPSLEYADKIIADVAELESRIA
jgi:hypothetical protein